MIPVRRSIYIVCDWLRMTMHLVGCDEQHYPVPSQFICNPCMKMEREGTTVFPADRFKVAAEFAEIDWCPSLNIPLGKQTALIDPSPQKPSVGPAS